ncbi:DUF4915 domain-containing protein [Lysobacter sp. ISL-50]|uniref:DUF4915 domain-containing protein n=1 Tax=unclassified Lysobacter TaxID=2635362 RepID=UPI001BED309F|nr:DUF4915 domain-containing protein [Lysobacter sp. ISL-42]MBT2749905.1 DUF4915 domain-containing protein [Lysobacter sp. ISL-50]MBT2781233.1 DUF4915 domain-containing protein [Lysobacter sp. ISL-52]
MQRPTPLLGNGQLAALLQSAGQSLLVASRQGNVVLAIHSDGERCYMSRSSAPGPMGIAVAGPLIALGTALGIKTYRRFPAALGAEASYLPIGIQFTGSVSIHDVEWDADGKLWFVNTMYSALCSLDYASSFRVEWTPSFVLEHGPRDCCHLNGMAFADGAPRYATALAAIGTAEGWRASNPLRSGVLLDLAGGTVADGLSLPHSPVVRQNEVWLLEAGRGRLIKVDQAGHQTDVAEPRGIVRGLDFLEHFAIIGRSRVRPSSGSVAETLSTKWASAENVCDLQLIDIRSGEIVDRVALPDLDEISTVRVVPSSRVVLLEPNPEQLATTQICRFTG